MVNLRADTKIIQLILKKAGEKRQTKEQKLQTDIKQVYCRYKPSYIDNCIKYKWSKLWN